MSNVHRAYIVTNYKRREPSINLHIPLPICTFIARGRVTGGCDGRGGFCTLLGFAISGPQQLHDLIRMCSFALLGVPAYASACASLVALVAERMDIPAGKAVGNQLKRRKEGRKEGRTEGRKDGRTEGRKDGRKEGREEEEEEEAEQL